MGGRPKRKRNEQTGRHLEITWPGLMLGKRQGPGGAEDGCWLGSAVTSWLGSRSHRMRTPEKDQTRVGAEILSLVLDIMNLRCLLQVEGREAPEERLGALSICPSTNLPTFIPTYSYTYIHINTCVFLIIWCSVLKYRIFYDVFLMLACILLKEPLVFVKYILLNDGN